MRTRSFRRHQIYRHLRRRLSEDRNQHYDNLDCPCWTDARAIARFKEQPKLSQYSRNPRRNGWTDAPLTVQERRAADAAAEQLGVRI
jgi:hypothetical protein